MLFLHEPNKNWGQSLKGLDDFLCSVYYLCIRSKPGADTANLRGVVGATMTHSQLTATMINNVSLTNKLMYMGDTYKHIFSLWIMSLKCLFDLL